MLRGNGVRIAGVGECASRMIGKAIGADDAKIALDADGYFAPRCGGGGELRREKPRQRRSFARICIVTRVRSGSHR